MLQAIMTNPGIIEFREIGKPQPASDEVLIRIKRIGVCGSDIHVYHGLHPYTAYPVVQGHEVGGVVAETGAKVTGFSPGDKVVFMPQVTCGECYPCRHGMVHICDNLQVMGFQTDGAAQEFFSVKAEKVLKLPATMSLDEAALIEPISVAVHSLSRGGNIKGRKMLVLGGGTIGNLVAQVAQASGAEAVLLTDISEYKLNKARECGIRNVVNPEKEDLSLAILKYFGPDKADLIMECVGVQPTITQAIVTARKGSTIVVVGVFGRKPEVDLGLVQDRELSLVGTLMYQKEDYERAIELAASGKLSLDPMVTQRFAFKDYPQAYESIEGSGGDYLKVMIDL
ncbi:MAG: alcohol dehydrogenase catalytic domain-containing protein [Anaerolineales bacterium]|uniref:Alcohol dehydrogenase catalytic domain-containing protein n=1 Tax=Candidatus Desulfolinea nitratireducens TaxID=2841698 RepID=A0A8J6TGX8_9CHLR|nr:alcohol dehydrogenase catalytic domain-containing protein [Candidatus Desulfolinea nitratireducens]